MPGVGKLLKQAQKMQKKMEALQEELALREIEISSGGGAVKIKVNGQQEVMAITLDDEFLKEDKEFVEETILNAIQEALAKAKEMNEEEMGKITGGMNFPGLG
jgi:DNA-binding YbaB/EbfC family protein